MVNELRIKTPEDYVGLLRDLNLYQFPYNDYQPFNLRVAHLSHPEIEGIYTDYNSLRERISTSNVFEGCSMWINLDTGYITDKHSIAPEISPNPVHISFDHIGILGFEWSLYFLQRFQDKGYRFSGPGLSLDINSMNNCQQIVRMGKEITLLSHLNEWASKETHANLRKYEVIREAS